MFDLTRASNKALLFGVAALFISDYLVELHQLFRIIIFAVPTLLAYLYFKTKEVNKKNEQIRKTKEFQERAIYGNKVPPSRVKEQEIVKKEKKNKKNTVEY